MAFNIKDDATVDRLRELAKIEGVSMNAAAAKAVEESLARARRGDVAQRLLELGAQFRADADPEWLAMTKEELDAENYDPETGLPW